MLDRATIRLKNATSTRGSSGTVVASSTSTALLLAVNLCHCQRWTTAATKDTTTAVTAIHSSDIQLYALLPTTTYQIYNKRMHKTEEGIGLRTSPVRYTDTPPIIPSNICFNIIRRLTTRSNIYHTHHQAPKDSFNIRRRPHAVPVHRTSGYKYVPNTRASSCKPTSTGSETKASPIRKKVTIQEGKTDTRKTTQKTDHINPITKSGTALHTAQPLDPLYKVRSRTTEASSFTITSG